MSTSGCELAETAAVAEVPTESGPARQPLSRGFRHLEDGTIPTITTRPEVIGSAQDALGDQLMEDVQEISGWSGLVDYLQPRYSTLQLFGERLSLTFDRDGVNARVGGRLVLSPSGQPWLQLISKLCSIEQLKTRGALAANTELPVGSISAFAEQAVLVQTLPLGGLLTTQLEDTLKAFAAMVADLRAGAAGADVPYAYVFR